MKFQLIYYSRKIHRYFGVIIGIQFIFWTIGGMFFAWSNMDQIHGDTNRNPEKLITALEGWQNPSDVFVEISKINPVDSLVSFKAINFLDKPFFQVCYFSRGQQKISLVNVETGIVRPPLDEKEAQSLAKRLLLRNQKLKIPFTLRLEWLTTITNIEAGHFLLMQ